MREDSRHYYILCKKDGKITNIHALTMQNKNFFQGEEGF